MGNILTAIKFVAGNSQKFAGNVAGGNNRANSMGEGLEDYIKNIFSGVLDTDSKEKRLKKIHNTFSYLGNQNNPPDMILKHTDAIEVKKIQSKNAAIALNSSYPKHKLYATDPRITQSCKNCEDWQVKDIIYTIGVIHNDNLSHLWLIYGDCYAANKEIYTRIGEKIKNGILEIPDTEFSQTKELGRVNKVDPLGITNLRIRGMWHIDNPLKVFKSVYTANQNAVFNLSCIIRKNTFDAFCEEDKSAIKNDKNIKIANIQIENPDNCAQLLDAKLITIEVM